MAESWSLLMLGTYLRLQPRVNCFVCMKAMNPAAAHVLYQGYLLLKLHTQYPEEGWFGRVFGRVVVVCASYMKCEPIYLSTARCKTEQVSTFLKQTLGSVSPNKCYAC